MKNKVTIQDIADSLGISRNTVSKAINNSDGIADATKEKILQKAIEMGYKQFSYVSSLTDLGKDSNAQKTDEKAKGDIAIFITAYIPFSHFASTLLDRIHEEITKLGYTMSFHRVGEENLHNLNLPRYFDPQKTKGIICVEIFDAAYSDLICSLDIPALFIDGPCRHGLRTASADILLMENTFEINRAVTVFASRGIRKFGFIGDYNHCQSFWERYCAYGTALLANGLTFNEKFVINTRDNDVDALANALDELEEMPEMFICANDFVAILAMQLIAQKNKKLMNRVRFLGFDDSHESRIVYPPLSTIHIHSQAMAFSALHLLMTRIKEPLMEYRTVYVGTDLILRDSTEF